MKNINDAEDDFAELPEIKYRPEQEAGYSDIGHSVAVERLLDGMPDYFEAAEVGEAAPLPRTLIIVDSLLHRNHNNKYAAYNMFPSKYGRSDDYPDIYPTREDIYTVQNRLRELGYTVYVWHKQSLVLLNKTTLLLEYDLQPSSVQVIRKAAAEKNIANDQLKIVTSFTWHNLIRAVRQRRGKEYFLQPGQLCLNDFFEMNDKNELLSKTMALIEWDQVETMYVKKPPEIDSSYFQDVLKDLLKVFPKKKVLLDDSYSTCVFPKNITSSSAPLQDDVQESEYFHTSIYMFEDEEISLTKKLLKHPSLKSLYLYTAHDLDPIS